MLLCFIDRNGLPERIAGADEHAYFEFVIQRARRPENRIGSGGRF